MHANIWSIEYYVKSSFLLINQYHVSGTQGLYGFVFENNACYSVLYIQSIYSIVMDLYGYELLFEHEIQTTVKCCVLPFCNMIHESLGVYIIAVSNKNAFPFTRRLYTNWCSNTIRNNRIRNWCFNTMKGTNLLNYCAINEI